MLFQNRLQPVLATFAVSLFLFGLPARLSAQWTTGTGGLIYYNGGNVGIGTATPAFKLTVSGNGSNDSGQADVQVTGGTVGGGINLISSDTGGRNWLLISTGSATGFPGNLGFYDTSVGTYRLVVNTSGNVGIGTTSPQHLLHVAGTIGAEQVIVSATGADYVFDPNYHLAPLREVAAYVDANHHLPGIPAAEEMKREGVSVGDMQTKLLAKVEELTLHMIELERQNQELKDRLAHIEGETKTNR